MIELIKSWDNQGQAWFFVGCFITIMFGMYCALQAVEFIANAVKVAFQGYPPESPPIEATECPHKDNLTHLCLKRGGNCGTMEECNREIGYSKEGD